MKLSSYIVFALIAFASAALAASAGKSQQTFDSSNMQRLLTTSKRSSGVIKLTDKNFDSVIDSPRDYAVAVLLTAESPQMGCQLCRQFGPDFALVGHSWNVDHPNGDGLFFAAIDFKDGQNTFKKLQLKTAPNLWIYPPTTGDKASSDAIYRYDMLAVPDVPASIIHFIQDHVPGIQITIHRPLDYSKIGASITTLFLALGALRYLFPFIKPIIQSKTLWAGISLVAIFMFTSGHMFNNIRHTPYVAGDRNGGVQYIAVGFNVQYGFETQIVAVVYAFLAFSVISLTLKVPRMNTRSKQTTTIGIWCTVILVIFSFLMFIFKIKNRNYPFSLPPFTT
ncbi:hypothetical protein V1511DRAFT_496807 [Dipodascopsis uninucleata]